MRNIIFACCTALLLAACHSDGGREKMLADIQALEKQMGEEQKPQPELFTQLIGQYKAYAKAFAADTLGAAYLAKAAELARLNQDFDQAIAIYEEIMNNYPEAQQASKALFMKGFTLDNDLKKTAEAKVVYEAFLQQYPNDDFADDTAFLLKNLGKSEEEIIQQFESGN